MTRRERPQPTRTWHAGGIAPVERAVPVEQVQDPAVRDILLTRRRALLMEVREIERRCGLEPDAPDDEVA